MRWFRWNSFTVIGLILLVIGVYSLTKGAVFQFDSGLPSEPFESWFYLLVGVLMVLNGVVQPLVVAPDEAVTASAASPSSGAAVTAAAPMPKRPVGTNIP